MMRRFPLIILLFMGVALFSQTNDVYACTATVTPMAGTVIPTYSFEDRMNAADVIVIGTVVDGETPYGNQIRIAEVEVERYYKGDGASIIRVDGFGNSAECRAGITVGSRYIILARQDESGNLWGLYFHGHSPLVNPSDENIESIVAVTNQDNPPNSIIDSDIEEESATEDASVGLILLVAVPILIAAIAGFILFILRRDGRKKKAKRS